MADELVIVFENAPSHEAARFVEVENATTGKSVEVAWTQWDSLDRWELGPFVKYEDAAALEAENERLRTENAELERQAHVSDAVAQMAAGDRDEEMMNADETAMEFKRLQEAARSILWMAREYAEAGGRRGPEMQDYEAAAAIIEEE